MGGEYQTDNHVHAYVPNQVVGWKTAPAGTEPPGWFWLWEITADGTDAAEVSVTYDWSDVDKETLRKVSFPLVDQSALEDSLARLSELAA